MPGPAAVPFLVVNPAVMHAVLAVGRHVVTAGSVEAASSATLAYVLALALWKRVPDWIREDVGLQNLLPKKKNSKNNTSNASDPASLSGLASVIEKLQALMASGAKKLGDDGKIEHLHVAVLVYVQLAAQLRYLYPEQRREWYQQSGEILPNSSSTTMSSTELLELKQHLNYAVWAYETDSAKLLEWLGHDFEIRQHNNLLKGGMRPGHVAHYLAVSATQKLVVIGIRGTWSLEDLLTDCCGRAVSYSARHDDVCSEHHHAGEDARVEVRASMPNQVVFTEHDSDVIEVMSGHERIWVEQAHSEDHSDAIRCHEGILICAKRLASLIQPVVEQLVLAEDYHLLLCGHSLGAGVASLLALVLRTRLPDLAYDKKDRIRVSAFAPPPVLDHDSAAAASSYTTSIINNADIIPRSSLANLAVFLEVLRTVSERLQEQQLAPTGPKSTRALIRKLTQNIETVTESDLLLSMEEVRIATEKAQESVTLRDPDHLYVPGRVLLMYETRSAFDATDDDFTKEEKDDKDNAPTDHYCVLTDGSAAILRFFEMDAFHIVTDHATSSYYESVANLSSLVLNDPASK